ncbi:hypothetical protein, variant [Aphanomyces astaci]|nr:hypothetical protein, variant [Aphanomyces astaci]ETV85901.1 hypothetical protein, variant [Aphanomyces astaci]|eukprot:XP_009824373.1 hypothetical protein, variant [Aphanomyces astaci]
MATPILYRDNASKQLVVRPMKWGLIPSYMKPDEKVNHYMRFNARSESMAETPAYRQLVNRKRCVVLFNGFYEWQKLGKTEKQPYFIHLANSPIMRMAGLYDTWRSDQGEVVYTYSIITTESPSKMKWIHTRMPMMLRDADEADRWLAMKDDESKGSNQQVWLSLVHPYPHDDLEFYPVTKQVGQATFDSAACLAKVDVHVAGKITSFYKHDADHSAGTIKNEHITAPLKHEHVDNPRTVSTSSEPLAVNRLNATNSTLPAHDPSSDSLSTPSSNKRPSGPWPCPACTFENDDEARTCAMCGGPSRPPGNEWTCDKCTFVNTSKAPSSSICAMCQAFRRSGRSSGASPASKKPKLVASSPQKPITSFFSP